MNREEGLPAAMERFNAGAPIAPVDASLLERTWDVVSRIPASAKQNTATGLCAIAGGGFDPSSIGPDQQVALMLRYTLLNALIDRRILDGYMKDDASRKAVFAAAASLPVNKNDLAEAMAEKLIRQMPPEMVEKGREELIKAGYDPSHLKVADKLLAWMRDNG